jgi:hypothetical protein
VRALRARRAPRELPSAQQVHLHLHSPASAGDIAAILARRDQPAQELCDGPRLNRPVAAAGPLVTRSVTAIVTIAVPVVVVLGPVAVLVARAGGETELGRAGVRAGAGWLRLCGDEAGVGGVRVSVPRD